MNTRAINRGVAPFEKSDDGHAAQRVACRLNLSGSTAPTRSRLARVGAPLSPVE